MSTVASSSVSSHDTKRQYVLFMVGYILLYSGVYGIFALISSVHIEGGIGTTSLAICYSSTILPALFVPFLAERFSVKKMFLAAIVCYFLFVFFNIFTHPASLIIAGIMNGLGESSGWTMTALLNVYFAKCAYLNSSLKNDEDTYVKRYFGYFWSGVESSAGIGNSFVYIILYIDRNVINHQTSFNNATQNSTDENIYRSFCGANDCQDPNITALTMQQYSPVSKVTYYVIVGCCMLSIVIAFLIHLLSLPDDIQSTSNPTDNNDAVDLALMNNNETRDDVEIKPGDVKIKSEENLCTKFNISLVQTWKMAFSLKHGLIFMLTIYTGFLFSFVYGELTRAYAACLLGLDDVSISIVFTSVGNVLSAMCSGRIAGAYGRNVPFAFGFVLDMALYMICLLLQPEAIERWMVYLLFFAFGVSLGVWVTLVNELYGDYFPENQDIAFNLWNVSFNVGLFIFYAISTVLCVYIKLYLLMAVLILAVFLYAISQFWFGYVSISCNDK